MIFCAAVQRIDFFSLFFYDLVKLFCLFCFYHYMVNKDYQKRPGPAMLPFFDDQNDLSREETGPGQPG